MESDRSDAHGSAEGGNPPSTPRPGDAPAPGSWLVGGGEMAKLIKAKDWSTTPLGPIERWPQSLRTTVSLAQASNSPISLAWGAAHVQIYNDGYWPICGAKHPASMGQDFRECWGSVFSVIGEAYAAAWSGKSMYLEKMRMFLDRYGFLEETWFTFSFSPITDESGGVGGLFHPVTEMTSQMLSERRTKTLRDLAARTGKAKASDEAFALSVQALGEADLDLPFVLFYSIDPAEACASLVGNTGLPSDGPMSPRQIALDAPHSLWPIAEVVQSGAACRVEVATHLSGLSVGPYAENPTVAFALPILLPGQERPAAVMIAGVSARLRLSEPYRGFYDLVAATVTAALANARAHEEERRKAEALAAIDRAKTTFFSNVSHEFRTPLTLMLGPIEDAISSEQRALSGESLQAVHRNALRLLKLVNSLLDFSRVEAGRLQLSCELIDLAVLTGGLAGSFQSLLESAGLRLTVHCPALPELVYIDPSHWEKIVLNLISNAFKFTFEGEIGVDLSWRGDHVELLVRDTGTGIAASELPRIFERFHRVEGARGRSFEGTGIGLSLVQELVALHGGSIRVSSELGVGTCFVVSVPSGAAQRGATPGQLPDGQKEANSRAAAPGPSAHLLEASQWGSTTAKSPQPESGSPARAARLEGPSVEPRRLILIADDNADMRQYLVRLLERHWDITAVADGRAALISALARPPDLVLSDVMMPELDGVALLRALRAHHATSTIPVILLSARAGEEAVLDGLETGADDYLVKPFSARELLSRVKTHLEMARVRAALVSQLEQKNGDLEAALANLQVTQMQLVQAAKMASLGQLVAGVAHEINNPLAFALGHMRTVQQSLAQLEVSATSLLGEQERAHLTRALDRLREMNGGLERIRDLVVKLRTFSRLDQSEFARVSMRESIESLLPILRHRLDDRIQIVTRFGEPDLMECHSGLMNQAVMSLVSNAIDAIDGTGTITVSTGAEGNSHVITVTDTGRGIPDAIRDRVFEPFFTTKPVGEGTGLGLSIAYSIVQKHRGELDLGPHAEGGTIARIRFPQRRGSSPVKRS